MIGPVETTDYHTGGEPFRIVTRGVPTPEGRTILERRRWAREHLDDVRQFLVNEPRGHADMYGAFVTPPDDDGADLGVVFFHNEGYSTACGHGTIALVTWAIDTGRVALEPEARSVDVTVDVPSGRLPCTARIAVDGSVDAVRFRNIPSFVLARGVTVETSRGPLTLDIAFGGAFYGSLDVRRLGLGLSPLDLPALIALQRELRPALEAALDISHPDEPELSGALRRDLLGARSTTRSSATSRSSPTARSTARHAARARRPGWRSSTRAGSSRRGSGSAIARSSTRRSTRGSSTTAPRSAVDHRSSPRSKASAYRTGHHVFTLDDRDELGTGFLLR